MDIKILFLFLVLLLVVGTSTKENLSKDFMNQASGGILVKKDNSMPGGSFNKDPNSKTFGSDLNSFIEKNLFNCFVPALDVFKKKNSFSF